MSIPKNSDTLDTNYNSHETSIKALQPKNNNNIHS